MARRYGQEIGFVGVAAHDTVEAMAGFVDGFGLGSFPHLADPEAKIWARFGVPYQPAWVFVSSTGEAVRVQGALPESELTAILDDLSRDRLPA